MSTVNYGYTGATTFDISNSTGCVGWCLTAMPAKALAVAVNVTHGSVASGSQTRVGLYKGGTTSDPTGATLVHDFGQLTGTTASAVETIYGSLESLASGDVLWLLFKVGATSPVKMVGTNGSGNFVNQQGASFLNGQVAGDPTVAFPGTISGFNGLDQGTQCPGVYITYYATNIDNIKMAAAATAATVSINIPQGSGNNRKLLGFAVQDRNTVDITSMTLNGVTGSQITSSTDASTVQRVLCFEWNDSTMPASAGNYSLACNGSGIGRSVAGIVGSGVKQTPYASPFSSSATGTSISTTLTADTGSIALLAADHGNAMTPGSNQGNILPSSVANADSHAVTYKVADFSISETALNSSFAAVGVALEPVATGITGSGATTETGADTASGTGTNNPFGSGAAVETGADTGSGSGTVTAPTSADVSSLLAKTALTGNELLAIGDAGVAKSVTPAVILALFYAGSGTVTAINTLSKATFRIAYATDGRRSGQGVGAGTGCPVWSDGTNWRTFYDNTVVAA